MDFLIHHLLQTSASRFPEREALVHGEQRLNYRQVAVGTAAIAHGLRCAGVGRGDRIGIYLDHSIPLALSLFGVSRAGGVFVPINYLLFPHQVAHIANDCQMKGLITTKAKLPALASVINEIHSLEFVVLVDAVSQAKGEKSGVRGTNGGELGGTSVRIYDFQELTELTSPPELKDVGIEKDLAAILYTSGSTGKPKGVMLSHANIMVGSSIVSTYLEITSSDRILSILPFSFDAGLNQITTAVQQAATLVMMTFVFAREVVSMLLNERITGLAGVPTLWSLISQPNSGLHKQELPQLRYITNTGGCMPQTVLTSLRHALPATKIYLMYGLTEAFRSTYLSPEELVHRPTSIGKAIPNTEILVINDKGQACQPGEIGELVHRGPTVSMGYWAQPELTGCVFRPHPLLPSVSSKEEKVCYSGDLVKTDEEGFLYFVGRRDNMIKSSGFRVSPNEVEEVLFQTGRLREVAVIGIPDKVLGQAIKAFVVTREGEILNTKALVAFCAKKMPSYMVPIAIEALGELPRTTSGKIDYLALRRREGF